MNSFLAAMQKYAVFQGRSSRSEFWYFVLFSGLVGVAAWAIDLALGTGTRGSGVFLGIAQLAFLIPGISVAVRRLHDIDRTGWWYLIGLTGIGIIVLIVFYCQRGTAGDNRFGPEPVETAALGTQAVSQNTTATH
jgi:uncharacterized membrane protein YhaH (DUF805 family)